MAEVGCLKACNTKSLVGVIIFRLDGVEKVCLVVGELFAAEEDQSISELLYQIEGFLHWSKSRLYYPAHATFRVGWSAKSCRRLLST